MICGDAWECAQSITKSNSTITRRWLRFVARSLRRTDGRLLNGTDDRRVCAHGVATRQLGPTERHTVGQTSQRAERDREQQRTVEQTRADEARQEAQTVTARSM